MFARSFGSKKLSDNSDRQNSIYRGSDRLNSAYYILVHINVPAAERVADRSRGVKWTRHKIYDLKVLLHFMPNPLCPPPPAFIIDYPKSGTLCGNSRCFILHYCFRVYPPPMKRRSLFDTQRLITKFQGNLSSELGDYPSSPHDRLHSICRCDSHVRAIGDFRLSQDYTPPRVAPLAVAFFFIPYLSSADFPGGSRLSRRKGHAESIENKFNSESAPRW